VQDEASRLKRFVIARGQEEPYTVAKAFIQSGDAKTHSEFIRSSADFGARHQSIPRQARASTNLLWYDHLFPFPSTLDTRTPLLSFSSPFFGKSCFAPEKLVGGFQDEDLGKDCVVKDSLLNVVRGQVHLFIASATFGATAQLATEMRRFTARSVDSPLAASKR